MADNKDFLTDEEMSALEKQAAPQDGMPDMLSDDEMQALESEGTTSTNQMFGAKTKAGAVERGLKSGVTMGLEDRIGAAYGAMGTLAGKSDSPVVDTLKSMGSLAAAATSPALALVDSPIKDRLKSLYAAYEEALPEVRQEIQQARAEAEEANPKTLMASQFVGSMLPLAAAGGFSSANAVSGELGSVLTPAAGAGLTQRMALGAIRGGVQGLKEAPIAAGMGAIQGIGQTEDLTDVPEALTNATIGGAIGGLAAPLGGVMLGGVAPAVKAGLEPAKDLLKKAATATRGIPRYGEIVDEFAMNLRQDGSTALTPANVKDVTGQVVGKLEGAGKELAAYHSKVIGDAAGKIENISKTISNVVTEGSSKQKQAILNEQLATAQQLLGDIVRAGEESGKGIGEMMRGASGTTKALKDSVVKLEKAISDNPYLAQNPEAQAILNQFKQAISEGGREVRIPMTTTKKFGEDEVRTINKDAIKGNLNLTPEEAEHLVITPREEVKAALPKMFSELEQRAVSAEALKIPNKVVQEISEEINDLQRAVQVARAKRDPNLPELEAQLRSATELRASLPSEEIIGTKTTTEMIGRIPGVMREAATAPEYLNTLEAVDDAIRKAGKDSPLGKALSEYRRNLVTQGRSELLGESADVAAELSKKYGAFKDIINKSNLGNKKELSDQLLTQLSSIVEQPDTAVQLNRFNKLKKTLDIIDPELAKRLETEFMRLNEAKMAIPQPKEAKQIAGFLQEQLPVAEQSAAARIGKQDIFDPLKQFEEFPGQAQQLEEQALAQAQTIAQSKEVMKLADANKILKEVVESGQMDPVAERYMRDLQDALAQLPEGEAKNVIKDNQVLFDRFRIMQRNANRTGVFSWDQQFASAVARLTGNIIGRVGRGLNAPFAAADATVRAMGETGKTSPVASRIPMLQKVATDFERKGLKAPAQIASDMMSSDPAIKASANFTASQIPSLRNLVEKQEEKKK
jgi:hypothetical protein